MAERSAWGRPECDGKGVGVKRRDVLKTIGAAAVTAVMPALPALPSDLGISIEDIAKAKAVLDAQPIPDSYVSDFVTHFRDEFISAYSARDQFIRDAMMAINHKFDADIMESLSRELH